MCYVSDVGRISPIYKMNLKQSKPATAPAYQNWKVTIVLLRHTAHVLPSCPAVDTVNYDLHMSDQKLWNPNSPTQTQIPDLADPSIFGHRSFLAHLTNKKWKQPVLWNTTFSFTSKTIFSTKRRKSDDVSVLANHPKSQNMWSGNHWILCWLKQTQPVIFCRPPWRSMNCMSRFAAAKNNMRHVNSKLITLHVHVNRHALSWNCSLRQEFQGISETQEHIILQVHIWVLVFELQAGLEGKYQVQHNRAW